MKLKICSICNKECYLWKSTPKLCKECALKNGTQIGNYKLSTKSVSSDIKPVEKRTPINRKSDKQKKIDAAYSVLRPQFLKARPYCEARLEGCTGTAVSVHHQYMGSNKRKHYLNTLTWTPICSNCHTVCHDKLSKEEQIEKGLRILD